MGGVVRLGRNESGQWTLFWALVPDLLPALNLRLELREARWYPEAPDGVSEVEPTPARPARTARPGGRDETLVQLFQGKLKHLFRVKPRYG